MVALLLPMTSCFIRINDDTIRKWNANHVTASGVMASERRSLDSFEDLSLQGSLDVRFIQADVDPFMEITISDNILPYLKTEVTDGTLSVRFHSDSLSSFSLGEHSITLYAPDLASVTILGSGDFGCDGLSTDKDFSITLMGSGDMDLKGLRCDSLGITIAGSGDIKADAQVQRGVAVSIAGSGDVSYNNMEVTNASSEIAGSGNIIMKGKASHHSENVLGTGNVDTSGLTSMVL